VRAYLAVLTAPLWESALANQRFRAAILGPFGRRFGGTPLIRLPFSKMVHSMVVAPPGSGKGVGFVIPTLLTFPHSVLVIDPKGENFQATHRTRRRKLGHRIVRLDPFQVCGPGGARLNPLAFISPKNTACADQCAALAEALVVESGREVDPHWNESSKVAITGAILYCVTYATDVDRTLNTVCDLLTDGEAFVGMVAVMKGSDELEAARGHLPAYQLLKRFGQMMATWRDRELGSILSSVSRHLAWMNSPIVADHVAATTFDPRWLHKCPTTVYLILPPARLSSLSRLLRLWLATCYGKLTEVAQEEKTVLFLLDECANIGPMPALYQAVTLGRGYGIRVALILQAISQLKSIFPGEGQAQTVEASIDTRVFFGVRDYSTADYLSNYLGSATIQVESTSTNQGASETGSLASLFTQSAGGYSRSTSVGTGTNQSEVGRALLQPAEILRLRKNFAIVLTPSLPPIKCDLAKYYATPELADAVLANRPSTADQEG
jgi:type IV secretion system protein VirD4